MQYFLDPCLCSEQISHHISVHHITLLCKVYLDFDDQSASCIDVLSLVSFRVSFLPLKKKKNYLIIYVFVFSFLGVACGIFAVAACGVLLWSTGFSLVVANRFYLLHGVYDHFRRPGINLHPI